MDFSSLSSFGSRKPQRFEFYFWSEGLARLWEFHSEET
jgi:hypothetical protein